MADTRPVRTEADYEAALARIDEIMDADPNSPDARELDVLVDLVELYESRHEPMGHPDPVSAIEFRMEQEGLVPRDLLPSREVDRSRSARFLFDANRLIVSDDGDVD